MINKTINQFIFATLASLAFVASSICGTDFAAINIPKSLQDDFINMQRFVSNRLKRNFSFEASLGLNLHITLKEISDLNHQARNSVRTIFKKLSQKIKAHDISHAIRHGHIKVKANGLVILKLAHSNWLTQLALKINVALKKLKREGKIKALFSRMDFPNHGHITLGYIRYKNKSLNKNKTPKEMIQKIEKKFKNSFNKSFVIDRFVLLRSNSPAVPRVYINKGTFYLG